MEEMIMKKYLTVIAALAVLAACQKAETPENEIEDAPVVTPDTPSVEEVIDVLYAYTEANGATKTTISDNGDGSYDVLWATTDRISVVAKEGSSVRNNVYRPTTAASESALTKVEGSGLFADGELYAYYPSDIFNTVSSTVALPTSRTLTNGLLADYPMYAEGVHSGYVLDVPNTELAFKNICGILRLKLSGEGSVLMGKVVLSADEGLAGPCEIEADGRAWKATVSGVGTLTLNVSGSITLSEGYDLWVPVPAGSYNNLQIKTYSADGTSYTLKTANKPIEIERSTITTITLSSLTLGTPVAALAGAGTSVDPFQLSSEADVNLLRELIDLGTDFSGKYFKVMNDFTITSAHKPLGSLICKDIDGGGFTITLSSGFDLSDMPAQAGFFSEVLGPYTSGSERALIHDLTIAGSDMSITAEESQNFANFGVLVGQTFRDEGAGNFRVCDITNCSNSVNVTISSLGTTLRLGGLMGNGSSKANLTSCLNNGSISVAFTANRRYVYIGGLAGNSGDITDCSNTGSVSFTDAGSSGTTACMEIGGISGRCTNFTHCQNSGTINAISNGNMTAIPYVGGITGTGINGNNCQNTGEITTQNTGNGYLLVSGKTMRIEVAAGGIAGNSSSIYNSYNNAPITVTGKNEASMEYSVSAMPVAGGIAGYNTEVYNCYNSGTVTSKNGTYNHSLSGGIVGLGTTAQVNHCYFRSYDTYNSPLYHNAIGIHKDSEIQTTSGKSVRNRTKQNGTNCSVFTAATLTTYCYIGANQGLDVVIDETNYSAADPGTPILTLLNAGKAYYESTVSGLLPWKAGAGSPAHPVFDE